MSWQVILWLAWQQEETQWEQKLSSNWAKHSGSRTGTVIVVNLLTRPVLVEWVNVGPWEYSCAEETVTPNSNFEETERSSSDASTENLKFTKKHTLVQLPKLVRYWTQLTINKPAKIAHLVELWCPYALRLLFKQFLKSIL